MHRVIQRGAIRSQVINVPEGLPELLSDITREVLRCQPTTECLCQFIIDYLYSVTETRDKELISKSIIDQALQIVDNVIADMCICDIPKAKADFMCGEMEECFRRFLAQRRCEKDKNKEIIKFNEFDMLDELMQKCKFTDDELRISKPLIEAAYQKFVNVYLTAKDSSEATDTLYQYFRQREIARVGQRLKEDAAVKIQSLFRGFLLRKSLFEDKSVKKPSIPLAVETKDDRMRQEIAALNIQRFFRRHLSVSKNVNVVIDDEKSTHDPCTPASDISLTGCPVHHNVTNEEDFDINKNYDQNQDNEIIQESILTKQDDNVIKDDSVKEDDPFIKDNIATEDDHIIKNYSVNKDDPVIGYIPVIEDNPNIEDSIVTKDDTVIENNLVTEDDHVIKDESIVPDDSVLKDDPVLGDIPGIEDNSDIEDNIVAKDDTVIENNPVTENDHIIKEDTITDDDSVIEDDPVLGDVPVIEDNSDIEDNTAAKDDTVIENNPATEADHVIKDDTIIDDDPVIEDGLVIREHSVIEDGQSKSSLTSGTISKEEVKNEDDMEQL